MTDLDSDEYWQTEFDITTADLDRLVQDIERAGRAFELIELARSIVRRRLLHGPERQSKLARKESGPSRLMRWFDQVDNATVGDHLIVLHTTRLIVQTAEVTAIEPVEAGTKLHVFLPEEQRRSAYVIPSDGGKWRHIKNVYRERRFGVEKADKIERRLLEHGEKIASQLHGALQADERFVRLSGRWFLATEVRKLRNEQIQQLAWSLVGDNEPQLTEVLAGRLAQGNEGDPWTFSVYIALRQHPELFRNVNPGPQPQWELAGPPPGQFTPQHSAYDPETFAVLVQPGIEADQPTVKRLWELALLDAVV